MQRSIFSSMDMLDVANDDADIINVMKSLTAECGYDQFAYVQATGPNMRTLSTYSVAWQRAYLKHDYARLDPVVTKAKRSVAAFSWCLDDWNWQSMSAQQRAICSEASDFGIRSGFTIPVRSSFGTILMLTMASSRSVPTCFSPADADALRTATIMTYYKLHAVAKLPPGFLSQPLTIKEIICLSWASRGKSMPEIADITGSQLRAVKHYLDNARAKLKAANLTHAVSLAKDYKIIE